ncbi:MAG: tRNA pseudouridine(38-40) synthase TruA [Bacteroidales bacterium]|nr:tRNA pseudouridine(38-40) synthase TruA [Bacteroidales bacterium]
MSHRYFIELSYRGTKYHGWQIQENAHSVQAELNSSLATLLKEDISTLGAGRTDTGVHAKYFVAHFDSIRDDLSSNASFLYHLNQILPLDISIKSIRSVEPAAHARFDATSRTYHYFICRDKDPFWRELAWMFYGSLDIDLMQQASKYLFNYTDFTSFSKVGSDNKTSDCKIYSANWAEKDNLLIFSVTADRFLRNMVRAIVGTMVDVGRKKITAERFSEIIAAKDRALASSSAPAEGLYLTGIEYPKGIYRI